MTYIVILISFQNFSSVNYNVTQNDLHQLKACLKVYKQSVCLRARSAIERFHSVPGD